MTGKDGVIIVDDKQKGLVLFLCGQAIQFDIWYYSYVQWIAMISVGG